MHELTILSKAALLAAPIYALGLLAARSSRPEDGYRGLERWTLGLAVAVAILFVLAAVQAFAGWVLGVAGATALAAGWRARGPQTDPRAAPERVLAVLTALGAACLLAPVFLLAINPTVLFDAAVYHLTLPRLYLEHGGFRPLEMSLFAVWPHGFQLLYAPALLLGGPGLAKLLHFGCGLLLCLALWQACRRGEPERGGLAGLLAVALFLGSGVVLWEMTVAYVDLAHALLFFSAFLFLERAQADLAPRQLRVAGLVAGAAAVTKVSSLLFLAPLVVPLAAGWLAARRRGQRDGEIARRVALHFALPVLAFWLPWTLRAWWQTGNPVYPFFWSTFGGPDWSADLQARFQAWQASIGMGRDAADYLLLPLRIFLAGGEGYDRFDGTLAPYLLFLLPPALWAARRPGLARQALAAFALYFALWALSSQQTRFLLPALPLLALALALGLTELTAPWLATPARCKVAGLLVAAIWLADGLPRHRELLDKGLRHWPIYRDARFAAAAADPNAAAPEFYGPLAALPPSAKVLLLNTNKAYYVPREFLADTAFEASQISDWLRGKPVEGVAEALAGRRVSHVLLFGRRHLADYPPGLLQLLDDPTHARPLWRSRDQVWELLELTRPPG
jgi:hypothetical protein